MSEHPYRKLAGAARAGWGDAETSIEGAKNLERKGKGTGQRALCLRGLDEHPDSTPYELARALGIEGIIPGKRLPELKILGLAEPGEPRICKVRGTKARPWRRSAPAPVQGDLPGMPTKEYGS